METKYDERGINRGADGICGGYLTPQNVNDILDAFHRGDKDSVRKIMVDIIMEINHGGLEKYLPMMFKQLRNCLGDDLTFQIFLQSRDLLNHIYSHLVYKSLQYIHAHLAGGQRFDAETNQKLVNFIKLSLIAEYRFENSISEEQYSGWSPEENDRIARVQFQRERSQFFQPHRSLQRNLVSVVYGAEEFEKEKVDEFFIAFGFPIEG